MFKPVSTFLLTAHGGDYFVDPFCYMYLCFMFVFYAILSVSCSLVITCWERAYLLAISCVITFLLVTFPYGFPDQVWYLIYQFMIFALFFTL